MTQKVKSGFGSISLCSLLAFMAFAQDTPKAVLLDEFGALPCEDLLGRTDALAAELGREPGATALILIRPPNTGQEAAQIRYLMISSTLQLRGVPSSRFSIFKGSPAQHGELETQYWKLPLGATPSVDDATLWADEQPDLSRPFMFGYEDEIGICPTFVPKNFARLILDNPESRGHIVVRSGVDRAYVNRFFVANQWIKELVEKQAIPRKRLKLFFAKENDLTAVEFWFVPDRKK